MHRYIIALFLLALAGSMFTGCAQLKDWGVLEEQTVGYTEVEVIDPETGEKETVQVPVTATGLNPKLSQAVEDYAPAPWGAIGGSALALISSVLLAFSRRKNKALDKAFTATVKNVEKLPDDAKAEFKKNQKLDTDATGKVLIDNAIAS